MFSPVCHFCAQVNPADAKFCNDCGSPLHLKPCKQCEAINDQAAKNCYKCGTEDPALVTTPEAVPVPLAADVAAASARPFDVDIVCGRPALPDPAIENIEALSRRQGNAIDHDTGVEVEVATHERNPSIENLSSPGSETLRATDVIPSDEFRAAAGRRPMYRVMLPAVLLIAVAISVYQVYRHPPQVGKWLSATTASTDEHLGGAPIQSQSVPGTIDVPMPSAPPVPSAPPAPSTNPDAGSQALPPNQPLAAAVPQPLDSASDQATAAQRGSRVEKGVETPETAPAVAAPPRNAPAIIPQPVTRPSACTEASAALGICSAKKTSTSAKTAPKKPKKAATKKPAPTQAIPAPKTSTTTSETPKPAPRDKAAPSS